MTAAGEEAVAAVQRIRERHAPEHRRRVYGPVCQACSRFTWDSRDGGAVAWPCADYRLTFPVDQRPARTQVFEPALGVVVGERDGRHAWTRFKEGWRTRSAVTEGYTDAVRSWNELVEGCGPLTTWNGEDVVVKGD